MKKVLTFICALAMCLVSCCYFVGCKKKNNDLNLGKIRLNEVTHSVFYAPLYVAINKGFMQEEGISIELVNGGGSDVSMAALLSGSADIALMGPETVVYVEASGSTNHPIVFGQLTQKDGCFLISKHKIDNFDFKTNLTNQKAIIGRNGGMPAMTFAWVADSFGLQNGVNVTFDTQTAFNMMVPVFEESDDVEFCTMFEPTASEFVSAGKGFYCGSVGEYSGDIPYTCFMAYPKFLQEHSDLANGFLRAVKKAYIFIQNNPSSEVAKALKPSFDGSSEESLAKAVEKYIEIDAWSSSLVMSKDSYNRLLSVLKKAGTLSTDVEMNKVVDNSLAIQI